MRYATVNSLGMENAGRVDRCGEFSPVHDFGRRSTMSHRSGATWLAAIALLCTAPLASPARAESRGELLYSTHCIACHTSQLHWRDNRLATDWRSLEAQVRRWQASALLGWSEADVLAVTRHLNQRFYRFAPTGDPLSGLGFEWSRIVVGLTGAPFGKGHEGAPLWL